MNKEEDEHRIAIKEINKWMLDAVLANDINKVEECLDFGANNFDNCIKFAARFDKIFILKSLVEVSSFEREQLEPALIEATKGKAIDSIRFLTENYDGIPCQKAIQLASNEALQILLEYHKKPPEKKSFFKF